MLSHLYGTPHSKECGITANLNEKNLRTKSPWDFEPIFDIRYLYWYVPHQNFFFQCRVTRWRCNRFAKKWPKSNLDTTLNKKNLELPLNSASKIFLRCTKSKLWFFCLLNNLCLYYTYFYILRRFEDDKILISLI